MYTTASNAFQNITAACLARKRVGVLLQVPQLHRTNFAWYGGSTSAYTLPGVTFWGPGGVMKSTAKSRRCLSESLWGL